MISETAIGTPPPALEVEPAPEPSRLWRSVGLKRHLAVILTLGIVVLLTYANSFSTGFLRDSAFILGDPRVRSADFSSEQHTATTLHNLKLILKQDYWSAAGAVSGLYRPLTTLSYWMNYAVLGNGTAPQGYHWVNFLLHWTNAALAYFAVMVLMGRLWPALFVAMLFAVHPASTESVTDIAGRADLLAGLSVLGGFLMYVKSTVTAGWRKVLWLAGLSALTAIGVFCKENAVVVPGVVFAYDLIYRLEPRHRNRWANLLLNAWGWAWRGYVAFVPPFLTLWYVRARIFADLRLPESPWLDNPLLMPGITFWTQRLTAIKVIGKYLWLLLWPRTLSCDYSYNQIPLVDLRLGRWEDWQAVLALATVALALLAAGRAYRRHKPLCFFMALFFVTLLPMANLLFLIGSIMAERFLYLPLIGFAGCVVIGVEALCRQLGPWSGRFGLAMPVRWQTVAGSLLGLLVVAYGIRAFARNFDWRDEVTLYTAAVKACPNSHKTHQWLAYALYNADPGLTSIDRVISECEKAKAVTGQAHIALLQLGKTYRIKGDLLSRRGDLLAPRPPDGTSVVMPQTREWYTKSVDVLRQALRLDQAFNADHIRKELRRGRQRDQITDVGWTEIYQELGLSLMRLAEYDQALEVFAYWRRVWPNDPSAYCDTAAAHLARNELEPVPVMLWQALLLDENRQDALRALVSVYQRMDPKSCAVVPVQGHSSLNTDCPLVATHISQAYLGLVNAFVQAHRYDLARKARDNAVHKDGCDPRPLDAVLPPLSATPVPVR